jgi:hypothetical protein
LLVGTAAVLSLLCGAGFGASGLEAALSEPHDSARIKSVRRGHRRAARMGMIDLAISMERRLIPFGTTGGAVRAALDRMRSELRLRDWITQDMFGTLDSCTVPEEFTDLVQQIIDADLRSDIRE